jgi:hypothetical protein
MVLLAPYTSSFSSSPLTFLGHSSRAQNILQFPRHSTAVHLYWGSDDDNTPISGQERLKSCIPYILPIIDLDPFSNYLCRRFSLLSSIHDILLDPLVQLFYRLPWLSILVFLAFTLGSKSATYLHRRVRFNAQQAALMDVALVIPQSIAQVYSTANHDWIPVWIEESSCNTIYLTFIFIIGYCFYCNGRGKKPVEIPWISDWAQLMTGPY